MTQNTNDEFHNLFYFYLFIICHSSAHNNDITYVTVQNRQDNKAVASQSSWGPVTDLGLGAPPLDPNRLK